MDNKVKKYENPLNSISVFNKEKFKLFIIRLSSISIIDETKKIEINSF